VLPLDATAANTDNYIGDTISRWTTIFSINALNMLSDSRMKTDIQDVTYGLDEVLAMRPVSFRWKEKYDDRTHLGLLAQDIEALIPEIVQGSDDDAIPLSMSYTDLIPVLIKAIQEQEAKIDSLTTVGRSLERASIATQDPRVDELMAEITALRSASNQRSGSPWAMVALVCLGVGTGVVLGRKRTLSG
jgi:hypothetical protein